MTPHSIVIGGLMGDGLADFHAGARSALERMYREHFDTVSTTVGRVVEGADQETVVHDVFLRLFTDMRLRRSFAGGALGGWLATVARRHAVEHRRRRECAVEVAMGGDGQAVLVDVDEGIDAAELIERFRAQVLPPRWERLFELRFVQRMERERAARALGIGRLRLMYREHRVRCLLSSFLRRADGSNV
jgi:RNA polymerase sigma-70 factor (ECF subfamily)